MKRLRFPIAGLMPAVVLVAINLAVWRSFEENSSEMLPHLFFASGVMPMASILILVALSSVKSLVRGGRLSPFVVGFEAVGWAVVFAFITCYSVAPSVLLGYAGYFGAYTRPIFDRYFPDVSGLPTRIGVMDELGLGAVIFSLPQLAASVLGGWLTRKIGLTARFELEGRAPAVPVSGSAGETARPDRSPLPEQIPVAAATVAERSVESAVG